MKMSTEANYNLEIKCKKIDLFAIALTVITLAF